MRAFVTVGATSHFDLLVQTVVTDEVLKALVSKGFNHLVIQSGPSKRFPESHDERDGLTIDFWNLKLSLKEDFQASDLIISHAGNSNPCSPPQSAFQTFRRAGSGSILDALRLHKPLIVVPNPTLLHNHQLELAEALEARGHLKSSTIQCVRSSASIYYFVQTPIPQRTSAHNCPA